MTHTLGTTAIARGVARALRLNEDLTESIRARPRHGAPAVRPCRRGGTRRVAARALRDRFPPQRAIPADRRVAQPDRGGARRDPQAHRARGGETREERIVRIVDRVAYINHDIDDAVRHGILDPADLPQEEVELLGPKGSKRIDTLVPDLVETSEREGDIRQSEKIGAAMLALRSFMFERVYLGPHTAAEHERARTAVRAIFEHLVERGDGPTEIVDYVAGMTDRFALDCAAGL